MTNLALDRMPPQIGNFIAKTVYPSDTKSEPLLKSSDHHPLAKIESNLCHFVDVPGQQVICGKSLKACILPISLLQTTSPSLELGGV